VHSILLSLYICFCIGEGGRLHSFLAYKFKINIRSYLSYCVISFFKGTVHKIKPCYIKSNNLFYYILLFVKSMNTTLSPCLSTPWTQPCLHVYLLLEPSPVSMFIYSLKTTLSPCLYTPWKQPCLHVYLLLEQTLTPCISTPWKQPCLHVYLLLKPNPVSIFIYSLKTTLSSC